MVYSVINEGVIPVMMLDGQTKSVGIREAIVRAHEIQDIGGENPLERVAMLRLLVAFAMDMMRLETASQRKALLKKGFFEEGCFDEYTAMCEKDGPRFDLFDPKHPFMQSAYDEKLDAKALKPVANLFISYPSGNNHVFVDHRMSDIHVADYAAAFRAMVTLYTFSTAGAQGYPSCVNNTPPVFAYLIGTNLFQTIVLNMLSIHEAFPLDYGLGNVPWRRNLPVIPKTDVPAVTLLEAYTFMPRRITLISNDQHSVREVYLQQGLNFKGNDNWNDPFVPEIKKKDGTYATVKPSVERALWREIGSLLYEQNGKTTRQPKNLKCSIQNLLLDDNEIEIRTAGVVTNQAQYVLWMEEKFRIPAFLMENEDAADLFREDVMLCESMVYGLYKIVCQNIDVLREGSVSADHAIADQCRSTFLAAIRGKLFGEVMKDIVDGTEPKEHVQHFSEIIKDILRQTIRDVIQTSGSTVEELVRQMKAEREIWGFYFKKTKERMEDYE